MRERVQDLPILRRCLKLLAMAGLLLPGVAFAAEIDGSQFSAWWGVPFAGILLSIALLPLVAPLFWHHHFGKVALAWSLAFLLPFAAVFGPAAAASSFVHALVAEYLPFIILLTALFTVAGGIYVRGNLHGSPRLNVGPHGHRRRAGELHGHHRRVDAADPPADPRQRQPQACRACRDLLHLHRLECGRLAHAAGRSAAVPGLPEGSGLLLDAQPHLSGDLVPGRRAAGDLLR